MKTKDDLRFFYQDKLNKARQSREDWLFKESNLIQNLSFLQKEAPLKVAAYKALDDEVSLESFFKDSSSIQFVFPRRNGKTLDFYEGHSFERNSYSLLEPTIKDNQKIPLEDIQVFLVPGRVFDRQGGRIGRGQSYYDKVLSQTSALKIGIALDDQIHDSSVPVEPHDILMDAVATNSYLLMTNSFHSQIHSFFQRTA